MTTFSWKWDFLQSFYGVWPHSIINNALCEFSFIHWSCRDLLTLINPRVISMNKVRYLFKGLLCCSEIGQEPLDVTVLDECVVPRWQLGADFWKTRAASTFLAQAPLFQSQSDDFLYILLLAQIESHLFGRHDAQAGAGQILDADLGRWVLSRQTVPCVPPPCCVCFTRCLTSGHTGMPTLLLRVYSQHICCCVNAKQQSKW